MRNNTLVIYDIVEDKVRTRIAETCKDYGLGRIQWSAFFGLTDRNRREEMMLKFRKVLGDTEGNIQMYVICDKDMRLKKELLVKPSCPESEASQSSAGAYKGRAGAG